MVNDKDFGVDAEVFGTQTGGDALLAKEVDGGLIDGRGGFRGKGSVED